MVCTRRRKFVIEPFVQVSKKFGLPRDLLYSAASRIARISRAQTCFACPVSLCSTAVRKFALTSGRDDRYCHAASPAFDRLHSRQHETRLPSESSPPRIFGSTWSSVSSCGGKGSAQYTQW